jgi:uncharacterized protein with HEPN domain
VKTHEDRAATLLGHIVEAIGRIVTYTEGMSAAEFDRNKLVHDAVERNLITIGEAAAQLRRECPNFVAANEPNTWRLAADVRNQLTHAYVSIQNDIVWTVVRAHLPSLLQTANRLRAGLIHGRLP